MRQHLAGLFFLLLISTYAHGQQAKALLFKEEVFDFGTVIEQNGPVVHEFSFTNGAGRPIKILSVVASCGCTTPGWSKEPVAPSKIGFVQASFNPQGRPGHFTKTLTVTTDFDANPIVLQIKGEVEPSGKPVETDYDIANGNWRLKTAAFNFGKVFIKDDYTVREFSFVNSSAKAVTYTGKVVAPNYIKVDVVPHTVEPGAKGIVKVKYNGKLKNRYGFQSDNVQLTTDDELEPVKSFNVYATLEDYFPQLAPEELAKAPRLSVGSALDFGRIRQNAEATRDIQITNTGKKELTIKSLQGNCSCINAVAGKFNLKPGESGTLRVTFNPEDRTGTQTKSVTIYSNDPQGPVQRVTVTAYVEN